ncbi:MAG TPA: MnhB domain-containing protein [Verrucomicrobiae bacterium]|nr:MnhB domain-containing protein [Verrucomicrobiae bacterium]
MNSASRHIFFAIFGAALLAFLGWGMRGLSPFGHYPGPYGDILNAVASNERHVQNVVTAVVFDYRGFDTLGEEFILFASVTGVLLLLRKEKGSEDERCAPEPPHEKTAGVIDAATEDVTRVFSPGIIGTILIFGVYMVLTGHLSVGGGFQGGAILSAAWLMIFLAYGSEAFHSVSRQSILEWAEAGAAGSYVLIGCVGLICGRAFLTNVLPLGQTGDLLSSGTILLIDCAVGVEVTAAFVLLLVHFLKPLEEETPVRTP